LGQKRCSTAFYSASTLVSIFMGKTASAWTESMKQAFPFIYFIRKNARQWEQVLVPHFTSTFDGENLPHIMKWLVTKENQMSTSENVLAVCPTATLNPPGLFHPPVWKDTCVGFAVPPSKASSKHSSPPRSVGRGPVLGGRMRRGTWRESVFRICRSRPGRSISYVSNSAKLKATGEKRSLFLFPKRRFETDVETSFDIRRIFLWVFFSHVLSQNYLIS